MFQLRDSLPQELQLWLLSKMMGRLVMYRVYFPARVIWRVFLSVLQEIWNTSFHLHIWIPDLFFPTLKAAAECIYEYTLRSWANEICLPRFLYIFLSTSVSVGRKFVLILIKESDFKKISCWESGFSRVTSTVLKNRTLNLSRMTCSEYRIHSCTCTSWISRHADIGKHIFSYSWLVIILYRHECSCYWMC